MKIIGHLGEALLGQWLESQAKVILSQNWHCRWGELDLIAQAPDQSISFIEVKTRQARGLDEGGRLALTPSKQAKIIQAAQLYLADHPALAELPMTFDVALIYYQPEARSMTKDMQSLDLGTKTIPGQGTFQFWLIDYIADAFSP